jgi:hypothetical protein
MIAFFAVPSVTVVLMIGRVLVAAAIVGFAVALLAALRGSGDGRA